MNNDMLVHRWHQERHQTRKWWARLTDEDLAGIEGKAERLADALQARYGYTRQHAESQSIRWMLAHRETTAAGQ